MYSRHSSDFLAICKLNHNFPVFVLHIPQRIVIYLVCKLTAFRRVIFSHLGNKRAISVYSNSLSHSRTKFSRCSAVFSLRTVSTALQTDNTIELFCRTRFEGNITYPKNIAFLQKHIHVPIDATDCHIC